MNKNDIRYIKTEQKLEDTFWELLADVGFQKMNVRMLTEGSGVNRTTFYIHFRDKYELLEKIESGMFEKMAEDVTANMSKGKQEIENLVPFMLRAAQYVSDNKERVGIIMSEKGDPRFLEKYISKMREKFFPELEGASRESRYAMAAVIGIITSLFGEWTLGGCEESPEEYIATVASIARKLDLFALIEIVG
jgi:AcrR family transcriptional regulator